MGLSDEQKRELVEFVVKHKDILFGKQGVEKSNKECQKLWEQISEKLDHMPGDRKGDWKKWRQSYKDLKKLAKKKASFIRTSQNKTGGGPPTIEKLTPTEDNLLSVIGDCSIKGIPLPQIKTSIVLPKRKGSPSLRLDNVKRLRFDNEEINSSESNSSNYEKENDSIESLLVDREESEFSSEIEHPHTSIITQDVEQSSTEGPAVTNDMETVLLETSNEEDIANNLSKTPTTFVSSLKQRRVTSRRLEESIKFSNEIKNIQEIDTNTRKSYIEYKMKNSSELLKLEIRKIEAKERLALAYEKIAKAEEEKVLVMKEGMSYLKLIVHNLNK